MPTTKSTLFTVSKDEWDTKEQQYGKRHLLDRSDVEQQKKIKSVASAIVKLHKSEGISQTVS